MQDAIDIQSWMSFAERFGFPTVALAAIGLGVWLILKWSANNVVKPLVGSVLELHSTLQRESVEKRIKLAHLEEMAEIARDNNEITARKVDEIHRVVVIDRNRDE